MSSWNQRVRTVILHPEKGRVQMDLSAIEIIRDPNRNQTESIIKSLCLAVDGLVKIQEEQLGRIASLQSQLILKNTEKPKLSKNI